VTIISYSLKELNYMFFNWIIFIVIFINFKTGINLMFQISPLFSNQILSYVVFPWKDYYL